uniref:TMEM175 family protein n=1 Tax=Microbulbifer agarilyticus TaxID=260552 RepID=UPI000255B91C|nr:TMEM175 family protein [Microbulbifer agarilyticus]
MLLEKNRLEAFSDGVFAILITLLILEIEIPELSSIDDRSMLQGLLVLLPKFTAFILSYLVLAIYWLSHHDLFARMQHINGKILWLNLLLLLPMCVIPFTTSLAGDYPHNSVSVFIYAIHITIIGIGYTVFERYLDALSRKKAFDGSVSIGVHNFRNDLAITLNVAACIMAFVWVPAAFVLLFCSRLVVLFSYWRTSS